MDEAAFIPEDEDDDQHQAPPSAQLNPKQQQHHQPPGKITRLEQLNQQLKEAIEKENYEKAAALRDEIRKLELRD
jgi:protein-arginine kinase activator protein McsA